MRTNHDTEPDSTLTVEILPEEPRPSARDLDELLRRIVREHEAGEALRREPRETPSVRFDLD